MVEGDVSGGEAMMIIRGRCEIFVERNGRRESIAYAGPYQILGEMSLLDNSPRTASVVATQVTEVEVMTASLFEYCLRDSNPFVVALLRVLTKRYRELLERYTIKQKDSGG